jgi:hypothetical protein
VLASISQLAPVIGPLGMVRVLLLDHFRLPQLYHYCSRLKMLRDATAEWLNHKMDCLVHLNDRGRNIKGGGDLTQYLSNDLAASTYVLKIRALVFPEMGTRWYIEIP